MRSKAVLIGAAPCMKEARALLEKIARSRAKSVLISGESGVGKDLAARLMHQLSSDANAPFTKISCTGSSEATLAVELFGQESGASVETPKKGLLERGSNGTVLLDEVAELSMALQAKLLRVLEEHSSRQGGERDGLHSRLRIVAATQRSLRAEVVAGRFREDLYYRLAVLHVSLPPLSAREGDVELLSKHFIKRFSAAYGKKVGALSPEALAVLTCQPWPGNVRELKYLIERAILLTESDALKASDLTPLLERTAGDFFLTLPSQGIDLAQLERDLLRQALHREQGNKTRAGALLGLTRDQVRHRVAKYDAPELAREVPARGVEPTSDSLAGEPRV